MERKETNMKRHYTKHDVLDHEKDYKKENSHIFSNVKWPWIADFIRHENLEDHLTIDHDGKIVDSYGHVVCDYINE